MHHRFAGAEPARHQAERSSQGNTMGRIAAGSNRRSRAGRSAGQPENPMRWRPAPCLDRSPSSGIAERVTKNGTVKVSATVSYRQCARASSRPCRRRRAGAAHQMESDAPDPQRPPLSASVTPMSSGSARGCVDDD